MKMNIKDIFTTKIRIVSLGLCFLHADFQASFPRHDRASQTERDPNFEYFMLRGHKCLQQEIHEYRLRNSTRAGEIDFLNKLDTRFHSARTRNDKDAVIALVANSLHGYRFVEHLGKEDKDMCYAMIVQRDPQYHMTVCCGISCGSLPEQSLSEIDSQVNSLQDLISRKKLQLYQENVKDRIALQQSGIDLGVVDNPMDEAAMRDQAEIM